MKTRELKRYLLSMKGLRESYEQVISQNSTLSKTFQDLSFVDFNAKIGLPLSPITGLASPIFRYELDLFDLIQKYKWLLVNKARKIGVSEIVLRIIAYKCFSDYAGYQVILVAGNREKHARKLMQRFQSLFTNSSGTVLDTTADRMLLTNRTEVIAIPSSSSASRGFERVKCIFLDEAAHFNVIDDKKVYSGLTPNLANTQGDYIIVSTPNGKNGLFHDLWTDHENEFFKHMMPYQISLGLLLDEKMIERAKKDTTIDFAQEYMCQFTAARGTIISEEMVKAMEEKYETWDI